MGVGDDGELRLARDVSSDGPSRGPEVHLAEHPHATSVPAGGDSLLGREREQRRLDHASQVAALAQGPICATDPRAVIPSVFL